LPWHFNGLWHFNLRWRRELFCGLHRAAHRVLARRSL